MIKRWSAVFTYQNKYDDFTVDFEEMEELQKITEDAPNWMGLIDIRIVYNHKVL